MFSLSAFTTLAHLGGVSCIAVERVRLSKGSSTDHRAAASGWFPVGGTASVTSMKSHWLTRFLGLSTTKALQDW